MKCIIADDEPLILKDTYRTAVKTFGEGWQFFLAENSEQVLEILERETVQVVLLDVEMPVMGGVAVAKEILDKYPGTNVIFVTGHEKYALEAFEACVSDFIVKPVNQQRLQKAFENLRFPIPKLEVRCFGRFEVFYDGVALNFQRSQSKEILAFLIDKRGGGVTEDEIRYLLWSEVEDTEKKRRYVRNIISDIRVTLKEHGVNGVVLNNGKGVYCVDGNTFQCDYYDYLERKNKFTKEELGNYMEQYDWAEEKRVALRENGR